MFPSVVNIGATATVPAVDRRALRAGFFGVFMAALAVAIATPLQKIRFLSLVIKCIPLFSSHNALLFFNALMPCPIAQTGERGLKDFDVSRQIHHDFRLSISLIPVHAYK